MSPNFDLTKAWNRKIRNVMWLDMLNDCTVCS